MKHPSRKSISGILRTKVRKVGERKRRNASPRNNSDESRASPQSLASLSVYGKPFLKTHPDATIEEVKAFVDWLQQDTDANLAESGGESVEASFEDDMNLEPNIEAVVQNGNILLGFYHQPPEAMPEAMVKEEDGDVSVDLIAAVYNLSLMIDGAIVQTMALGTLGMNMIKWCVLDPNTGVEGNEENGDLSLGMPKEEGYYYFPKRKVLPSEDRNDILPDDPDCIDVKPDGKTERVQSFIHPTIVETVSSSFEQVKSHLEQTFSDTSCSIVEVVEQQIQFDTEELREKIHTLTNRACSELSSEEDVRDNLAKENPAIDCEEVVHQNTTKSITRTAKLARRKADRDADRKAERKVDMNRLKDTAANETMEKKQHWQDAKKDIVVVGQRNDDVMEDKIAKLARIRAARNAYVNRLKDTAANETMGKKQHSEDEKKVIVMVEQRNDDVMEDKIAMLARRKADGKADVDRLKDAAANEAIGKKQHSEDEKKDIVMIEQRNDDVMEEITATLARRETAMKVNVDRPKDAAANEAMGKKQHREDEKKDIVMIEQQRNDDDVIEEMDATTTLVREVNIQYSFERKKAEIANIKMEQEKAEAEAVRAEAELNAAREEVRRVMKDLKDAKQHWRILEESKLETWALPSKLGPYAGEACLTIDESFE